MVPAPAPSLKAFTVPLIGCAVITCASSLFAQPATSATPATSTAPASPPTSASPPLDLPPSPATPSPAAPAPASDYAPPLTPGYTYLPPIALGTALAPPMPASEVPRPLSPQERERAGNSHVDRVILMPTAETHPKGTLFFSSYEILILQAGYAFEEDTQVSLTLTPPLGDDGIAPIDFTLKSVVARAPRVRLAVLGSASGIIGLKEGAGLLGRVGASFQGCFDNTCLSSASLGTTLLMLGPEMMTANAVGVILNVSETVDWLFELDSLVPLGRQTGIYNGVAAGTGVRISGKHLGLDLTLIAPLDRAAKDLPVLPFLAASYRENLME